MVGALQGYMMSWVAERVAEQRLLWRLRGKTEVVASHPDDVSFDVILPIARRTLQKDHDRHRIWLVVDLVLLVGSGVLALVPGPNFLAYYFAFRVVGHWLSMRGAAQGLHRVRWSGPGLPDPDAPARRLGPAGRRARRPDPGGCLATWCRTAAAVRGAHAASAIIASEARLRPPSMLASLVTALALPAFGGRAGSTGENLAHLPASLPVKPAST